MGPRHQEVLKVPRVIQHATKMGNHRVGGTMASNLGTEIFFMLYSVSRMVGTVFVYGPRLQLVMSLYFPLLPG